MCPDRHDCHLELYLQEFDFLERLAGAPLCPVSALEAAHSSEPVQPFLRKLAWQTADVLSTVAVPKGGMRDESHCKTFDTARRVAAKLVAFQKL